MSGERISVALCTHNGGSFLKELLDSLDAQTVRPAELIVCDDVSIDETLDILKDFERHASFPVKIYCNPVRLGVVRNFDQAIRRCSGQIIALSDQDDIWYPEKLARLVPKLAEPGCYATFCNADVVDEALRPMGYTIWQRVCFTPVEQCAIAAGHAIDVLLKHDVVTGATLAFRAELVPCLKDMPEHWPHDAWIAVIAAVCGDLTLVDEPLLAYRQHYSNVVGGRKKAWTREAVAALNMDRADYYRKELERWRVLMARLYDMPAKQSASNTLAAKLTHLSRRASLPPIRLQRIAGVARELFLGNYSRYARNWGSVAIDLLVR